MKLSEGEKLILVMLAEIQEHLGINREADPKVVKECVLSDQTWGLKWAFPHLADDRPDPPQVKETADILSMYDYIGSSYARLGAADKAKVDAANSTYLKFQGFDGNNDPHYSIMNTLTQALGRWTNYPPHLNSHSQFTINKYRAMMGAMDQHEIMHRPQLSADELLAVLEARP